MTLSTPARAQTVSQPISQSDTDWVQAEKDEILFQLKLYTEVTEHLDSIFRNFSDGYLSSDESLKKISLLRHEYNKLVDPHPDETSILKDLVNKLLSRIEYYFIYFKRVFRENPEINLKVAQTRFELAKEAERLRFLVL